MLRQIAAYAAESRIASIHPLQKAALFLPSLVLLGFCGKSPLPVAYTLAAALIMHFFFKSPLSLVLRFTSGMFTFAILTSLAMLADYGVPYVALLVFRSVAGMLSILLFSLHTPVDDLLCCLSKSAALKDMCDIAKSTLRFLVLIEDELRTMTLAAKSRNGFGSYRKTISTTGTIAGLLFVNTMRRWQDIKYATDSRCYRGVIPYSEKKFERSKSIVLMALAYNAVLVAIIKGGI